MTIKSVRCVCHCPNQDIADKLIERMTGLFETKLGITFANKEIVLELDGCSIEAHIHQITWMLAEHWIILNSFC
jgi:hypothetical protein